jgi:hybrid cluster-associated redox disulfide protein
MHPCEMIKMKKEIITKDMTLGEVTRNYPETVEVFLKFGLPCAMCHVAFVETIEEGAKGHGINLNLLLKELNKVAKKKK